MNYLLVSQHLVEDINNVWAPAIGDFDPSGPWPATVDNLESINIALANQSELLEKFMIWLEGNKENFSRGCQLL